MRQFQDGSETKNNAIMINKIYEIKVKRNINEKVKDELICMKIKMKNIKEN